MFRQFLSLFSGSAVGKITGILREVMFASFFGTSTIMDAYRATFTTTISFSHLFTSEALDAAFIPQFRNDREDRSHLAWSLFNGVGLLLVSISVVAGSALYFLAPIWISLLFPGFTGDQFELAVQMLKIMACGVPLYIVSALLVSLEIGSGSFRLVTLRPFTQNAGVIAALVVAFFYGQPIWIAWGFTGTYMVFALLGAGWMVKKGILERGWHRHWDDLRPVAKRFWSAMKPLTFFSVLLQANIVLEKAIASLIGPGAVATIDYARLIPETAQVLIIVPLGLVSLSAMVTLKEEEVRTRTDRMSAIVLLLLVPLSSFVFVSAPDIVRLLYGRGAFDEDSVLLTSQALRGMAIGMWAVCLAYILQKVYNARLRNREVLRITAVAICANAFFNIVAYRYLGVLAIGLGFSLGGIVMAWFYHVGMGGMERTGRIAKICLFSVIPYTMIGLLLNSYAWMSLLNLMIQIVWALIFWVVIFWIAPVSRDMLQQLSGRLVTLRVKG